MKNLVTLVLAVLLLSSCGGSSGGDDGDALGFGGVDVARDNDVADPGADTKDPADTQGCVPNCAGKVCGDNGCGGSCGACNDGTCVAGQCQTDASCDVNGFNLAVQQATYYKEANGQNYMVWQGANAETAPFDLVILENYQYAPYNGPSAPGTYDLAGTNYKDCGLCLLALSGCSGETCKKRFYADEGTVEIQAISQGGSKFQAIFHNVQFKEVTIDEKTFESKPVAGGQTWCMNNVAPNTDIALDETKSECVAAGTGIDWNDNIADFQLQNCNGQNVKLHSFCGKKAVWIVAVAGWCSACAELAPQVQKAQDDYGSAGLQVMLVLGENAAGNAPNLTYCKQWANSHNVDPANVYLDNSGGYSWATLFAKVNTYSGGTISLPFNIILDGNNMEYVWCDNSSSGDINSTLSGLLN